MQPAGVISRSWAIILIGACVSGLAPGAYAADEKPGVKSLSFLQLSDTHWGFSDPAVNPNFATTLRATLAKINSLDSRPDFVIFTGDLTHTTGDPKERSRRLEEFAKIAKELNVKDVRFLPGEHDAGLDHGAAYQKVFGQTHYSFDLKGVHFVVLDNVSEPTASLGAEQLQWLSDDLKGRAPDQRIVVFTHRPLFDLYPNWDWATRDGAKALDLLRPFAQVTVFYGHIHQVNAYKTGNITLISAKSLMYPLPAPGSLPKKAPMAWDKAEPYQGLGFRGVHIPAGSGEPKITEYAVDQDAPVVSILAKKFAFVPQEIVLKRGTPAILELTSQDVMHGYNCPDLRIRADLNPGKLTRIHLTPGQAGTYAVICDVFCGEGHGTMAGKITVQP